MENKEKIARGERIRTVRLGLNLNQKDFGEKLCLKTSTISGYESGESDPKPETLAQIAMLGHVSLDYLITGRELIKSKAVIAATVEPGTEEKRTRMRLAKERNILLRKVVEWLDETSLGTRCCASSILAPGTIFEVLHCLTIYYNLPHFYRFLLNFF